MFNTSNVGKKIAQLRKEKNLTQMELADILGVSYQAVSNWERGNSMPDISKLPELVQLLGCSIDSLLSENKESALVKHVIKGDEKEYIKAEKITVDTLAAAAPVLKPSQTENLLHTVLEENEEKLTTKDLISIAPFIGEEFLEQWVNKIDVVANAGELVGLAPFLEEDQLDRLAKKITEAGSLAQIIGLAPFLSEETLDDLVKKADSAGSIREIIGLAPFLSEETLDGLVDELADTGNIHEIVGLAPFIGEETLDRLVMQALEKGEVTECKGLYPFLGNETLHKLADALIKKEGFNAIKGLAPFL